MVMHDALSGLVTRYHFIDAITAKLKSHEPLALFFVDVDHFKAINDEYGYGMGDHIIGQIGSRLKTVAEHYDGVAARLGGDEFCLLLMGDLESEELSAIARFTAGALSEVTLGDQYSFTISTTIGISRSPVDALDAPTLLHYADVAMYRGKRNGRAGHNLYNADIDGDPVSRTLMLNAIENGEIVPFFQPIFHLSHRAVIGFEVLARWTTPAGGFVLPDVFIPVVEQSGLIDKMTRSIVRQACIEAKRASNAVSISVNITASMITRSGFADDLLGWLDEAEFPSERFEIEITESLPITDFCIARDNLSALKARGIKVALDDFGTGYCGLYYLTRFPIDKIKIDRSFFSGKALEMLPMVRIILELAAQYDIEVTAEGVEHFHLPELPGWLANNGCVYVQGHGLGEPAPAIDVVRTNERFDDMTCKRF